MDVKFLKIIFIVVIVKFIIIIKPGKHNNWHVIILSLLSNLSHSWVFTENKFKRPIHKCFAVKMWNIHKFEVLYDYVIWYTINTLLKCIIKSLLCRKTSLGWTS